MRSKIIEYAAVFLMFAICFTGGYFMGSLRTTAAGPDVIEFVTGYGYEDCHTHHWETTALDHAIELAESSEDYILQRVVIGADAILHCEAN